MPSPYSEHCFPVSNIFSSLSAFRIFKFIFSFWRLIMMCLSMNFFGSTIWVLSAFWICRFISFSKFGRFQPLFFQIVSSPILFLLSSWDSNDMNVISFVIVPQVPEALFISSLFSLRVISICVSSSSLNSSVYLLHSSVELFHWVFQL